jgi:2-hydroxy-3-keto-5-methylthiopentenyl-1-phosphate phosphatase
MTRRYFINPKNNKKEHLLSGFGFYDLCPDLPEKFRKETMDLKLKYLKYENDNTISFEERDKYIHYLFSEDIKKIVNLHLNNNFLDSSLENTIKFKPFYFRYGVKRFYELLKENNIIQIIISGGVKESIEKTLQILFKDIKMENIKIISNEFIYDDNDNVIDYKKPLIYTFNKSQIFKDNIKNLENKCILFLGDHINDIDTILNINCLEKVGIAFNNNKNDNESNNIFLKKYDCVICNDGDFIFINELIQEIINKS